ncbi:MAG: hypothetical protein H7257_01935 [Taibaiella sp.]|nr:hypothetical protein [Taibaiella sp.]
METEHSEVRQPATVRADTPSYRWIENAHILLWLLKDTFWAMEWRTGALIMIFPTLSVAFWLLWRSRKTITDLMHNLAVCLWISGNSIWMGGEFFKKDMRPVAVVLFVIGLTVLAIYYLFYFKKDFREIEEK